MKRAITGPVSVMKARKQSSGNAIAQLSTVNLRLGRQRAGLGKASGGAASTAMEATSDILRSVLAVQHGLQLGPFPLAETAGLERHGIALQHPLDSAERILRQRYRMQAVLLESFRRQRHPFSEHVQHGVGVDPDLVLRVRVGAQAEEVHEVVEIDLPIPLGVEVEAQVHARELARQALL